ncbi:hypothetical protein Aduo_019480 [Ancylostoma duodenale]
MYLNRR